MTSFFRFTNKRAIYLDGKISLTHARCTHLSQVIKSQNKTIYTPMASMIYFDSDMSNNTNTVVYFDGTYSNLYLRLRAMSHTVYAATF
jgi:protein associated with RNAse G/E